MELAQEEIDALESQATAPRGFVARTDAIDALELHVLNRLQRGGEGAEQAALHARAHALLRRWEERNERVLRRLGQRIRAGRYTREGLLRAFARCLEPVDDERGYGALDSLFAGLLDAGELPDERIAREPEMVAYQPTPARAILALLERGQIGADDVFYDLGSGLGRVVILVALLAGARAKGIEIEPGFCEYAARCAARLGVRDVEFIQADAREAPLSGGTVYFLYTPFRGALLQRVLARLQLMAAARPIRVCSFGPCTAEIARAAWLQPLAAHSPRELAVFQSL
jgi:hypothetical protein